MARRKRKNPEWRGPGRPPSIDAIYNAARDAWNMQSWRLSDTGAPVGAATPEKLRLLADILEEHGVEGRAAMWPEALRYVAEARMERAANPNPQVRESDLVKALKF